MRPSAVALLCLLALPAGADAPWDQADLSAAKALHDQSCIACHARIYGGDGSKMYTRDSGMLANRRQLLKRVATCNAMVNADWFPEDEAAVAAWLNRQYYHFAQ